MVLPMLSMRSIGSEGTPVCLRRAGSTLAQHILHTVTPQERVDCLQLCSVVLYARSRVYFALPGKLRHWLGLLCWRGCRLAACGGQLSWCGCGGLLSCSVVCCNSCDAASLFVFHGVCKTCVACCRLVYVEDY